MKIGLFVATLSAGLLLTVSGCIIDKLSTVDYNNKIVDLLNPTLDAMGASLDSYENTVPLTVYPDSAIDIASMQTTYDDATTWVTSISTDLMTLQSWNSDQQSAVRTDLAGYEEVATAYLTKYKEMLDYYGGDFT